MASQITAKPDENKEAPQLRRVVADLYSGQMLGAVKEKSFGLLSVARETRTAARSRILRPISSTTARAGS